MMKFTITVAFVVAFWSTMGQDLVVTVRPPAQAIHAGDHPQFSVTITNRGSNSVTLVRPGDGSEYKMRTPFVGWSILPAEPKKQKHPELPPAPKSGPDCLTMNPIELSDIFYLKPGESSRLGPWVGSPSFEKPGRFRLVFYYQNIPDFGFLGDDKVRQRIRGSTPCRLASEEIEVDVLPKSP